MKIKDSVSGTGGKIAIISGAVLNYAALPAPASSYTGQFWLVQEGSGGLFSLIGSYKYPRGVYSVNASNVWELTPFNVKVSEDSTTLINITNWAEWFAYSFDIGAGDILIYSGTIYVNLTGSQTATAPDTDSTNWGFIKLAVEYIDFNTSPGTVPSKAGRMSWNSDEFTLNIDTGIGPVLQINQEDVEVVYNNSGLLISNGTVVNGVGNFNGFTLIEKSDATIYTGVSNPLVTTMDIATGSYGICTTRGKLRGIDTTIIPGSGTLIYIDPTILGGITRTRPEFPNYTILLGDISIDAVDGTINIDLHDKAKHTLFNAWDGSIRETFDFRITSDGVTITGTLTNPNVDTDNLTLIFSSGFSIYDASAATISLTPGTATTPQLNYVYILESTKVLTLSTTGFPDVQHAKIAKLYLQDATSVQNYGALRNQNINDHVKATADNGHLLHMAERIRQLNAGWDNGCLGSLAGTPTNLYFSTTSGEVWQMHKQVIPAQNMATGDDIHVVNDPTTPFRTTTNLNDITDYSTGLTWNNEWSNIVLWGVANKSGEISHIMINLPLEGYTSEENAIFDRNNFTNYTIPIEFKGVGFLIGRYTIRRSGTTFTYNSGVGYLDLRGFFPNNTAGGSAGSSGITEFSALTDTPSSYVDQKYKIARVNVGETALEFGNSVNVSLDVSADNTLTNTDGIGMVRMTTGAADKTTTLAAPAAANLDKEITFYKDDNGAGNYIVSGAINGTLKFTIFEQNTGITVKSNGVDSWDIIRIIGRVKQIIQDPNYRTVAAPVLGTWYQPAGANLEVAIEPGLYKLSFYIFNSVLLQTTAGYILSKHQFGTSATPGNLLIGEITIGNIENWYGGSTYCDGGIWGREQYYNAAAAVTLRLNSQVTLWAGTPALTSFDYRGTQAASQIIAERVG